MFFFHGNLRRPTTDLKRIRVSADQILCVVSDGTFGRDYALSLEETAFFYTFYRNACRFHPHLHHVDCINCKFN